MASNGAESSTQARKPDLPGAVMADKSKGTRSHTPPVPSNMGDHIPDMAASVMAAPKGKVVSGMSGWPSASMQSESRMPTRAPDVMMDTDADKD